jgi:hypothetical protein
LLSGTFPSIIHSISDVCWAAPTRFAPPLLPAPRLQQNMALLQASRLAQGAFGVATPVTYNFLQSLRGLATTSSGSAAAAAQPLEAVEDETAAVQQQAGGQQQPRWRTELGVIRTDWT